MRQQTIDTDTAMMYKRQITGHVAGIVALALLCSCTEGECGYGSDIGPMRLGISLGGCATRGTMIGSLAEFKTAYATDGISVWMYDRAATPACLIGGTPFKSAIYNDTEVWIPGTGISWPSVSTDLYAYAPVGASVSIASDGTFSYTVPLDNSAQVDLTVACSTEIPSYYQIRVDGGILPLIFKHALSAVRFQTGTPMVGGTFKSATVGGIYTSGTYTFPDGSWAVSGSASGSSHIDIDVTTTPGTPSGSGITARTETFFVMPQTFAANTQYVEVVFNDGLADHHLKKYHTELSDSKWEPGKEYIYTVSLSNTEIVLDCTVAEGFTDTTDSYFTTSWTD